MAGNENSGGIIRFKLSEKKFEEKINAYKNGTADGTIPAPCPSDWYVFIDQDLESMRELMRYRANKESAYYNRAWMAKRMLDWCRNQLNVHPFWSTSGAKIKAMMLLKQDWGDGEQYREQDAKSSGPSTVKVVFGGNDPRAKKAAK